jgi:hypothetical protein
LNGPKLEAQVRYSQKGDGSLTLFNPTGNVGLAEAGFEPGDDAVIIDKWEYVWLKRQEFILRNLALLPDDLVVEIPAGEDE